VSVWWPGFSTQLENLVNNCSICCKFQNQPAEPLIPCRLPTLPWQKVATDLFNWKGSTYLLIVDYFSKFIEISKLRNETSEEVICHLKSIFARHGIPLQVFSDNGPQHSSTVFSKFSKTYQFVHTTSSPRFRQSNGEAERAVRTIKSLLSKSEDPYTALLAYIRSTPIECGYSPAQLLMNRQLRSTVPIAPSQLKPAIPDYSAMEEKEKKRQERQRSNYNERRRARELSPLLPGDHVWITDQQTKGAIDQASTPRSYQVATDTGTLRRNCRHLNPLPQTTAPTETELPSSGELNTPWSNVTVTRSGRVSKPTFRLLEDSHWN